MRTPLTARTSSRGPGRRLVRAGTVLAATALLAIGAAGQSWASTPTVRWATGAPTPVSTLKLPMSVDSAPDASGIYFAYYTTLESGTRPYAGFQPKPVDANGHRSLQAVFSSFNADATTTDAHCSDGADGGEGVSCAVRFAYTPGTMYSLVLKRAEAGGDTQLMSGEVVETATGASVAHIGSFSLPSGSGRFKGSDQGFIEPYLTAGCGQQVTVTYGKPVGTEAGEDHVGSLPTVTDPASGSCLSTTSKTTGQGQQVSVRGDDAAAAGR
ncbi:DUF3472 domain-containing protein [Streptomyces iconiensis]|uniref:Uncharacterized protein n=1 Tax=Streptomyces iconiensis TaxID=1384038 RepID=A0ABT7A405_9ACTN|nr:hypothetical protein [Streptomyces iconiensis]MDJ1135777.1 hypothetical protein [Streptomyces iconiensis]